jgi:membrane-bound lytic murein transglycosylase D
MRIITALFFAVSISAAAQKTEVPHKMAFAGMTLTIRDDARREIQKDVDALTLSAKHFNIKAERAKTYFPIIEKIFADEGVPDDFKYLALQESSLVPDAVSSSNAVGFWQFKDFTAIEMGLRVDKHIDERLNIASSSRAAARYIKKNNTMFDNWIYALQAYQMGAGGVSRSIDDPQSGTSHFEITSRTYWYVKKFLAHKIAYEESCKGKPLREVTVYENKSKKTLEELSREFSVPEEELHTFNKWVMSGTIPDDRTYVVLIPGAGGSAIPTMSTEAVATTTKPVESATVKVPLKEKVQKIKINGILAILAIEGDNATTIATRGDTDLSDFLKWNDLDIATAIIPGTYYYLGKKFTRAQEDFYTVAKGESLWFVSQKFGVKVNKLKKYNRLESDHVSPGTILWLSSMKPKDAKSVSVPENVAQVSDQETFAWEANPTEQGASGSVVEASTSPLVITVTVKEEPAVVAVPIQTESVVTPSSDSVGTPVDEPADSVKIIQLQKESEEVNSDTTRAIVVVVTEQPVPVKQAGKNEHVVMVKETLYSISKMYNVGVMDLVAWNNLDLQQGIKVGQILKVADPQPITKTNTTSVTLEHEVKATDTLYGIARKYNVTIKELMDWNNKKEFTLSVGEKLKIKGAQ